MQFIAEDPIHVVIRNETPALYDTAGRMVAPVKRRVFAKFVRGVAPGWALAVAQGSFEFRKMPMDVTFQQWVAYYDSVEDQGNMGWTDEEREAIEEKLYSHHACVVVERPKVPAPWPKYDEIVASKEGLSNKDVIDRILARISEDGYDPKVILDYELENRRRKSVIDALEELMPGAAPVEEPQPDEQLIEA